MTNTDKAAAIKALATTASDIQDACNLIGVLSEMSRTLLKLKEVTGLGSDALHRHPITVAFADKIASLTGTQTLGHERALKAFAWLNGVVTGRIDPTRLMSK